MLHATYQRLFTQPIDDYTFLLKDEQYMSNAPDAMRGLLGPEIFFSSATADDGLDGEKLMKSVLMAKQ